MFAHPGLASARLGLASVLSPRRFLILINTAASSPFFHLSFIPLHPSLARSHVAQRRLPIFHPCPCSSPLPATLSLARTSTHSWIRSEVSAVIAIAHLIDLHVDPFCCLTWLTIFYNGRIAFSRVAFALSLSLFPSYG